MRYNRDQQRPTLATRLMRDEAREHLARNEWLMWGERYLNALGELVDIVGQHTTIEFDVRPHYTSNTATLSHYQGPSENPAQLRLALDLIEKHCDRRLRFTFIQQQWQAMCHLPANPVTTGFYIQLSGSVELLIADRAAEREDQSWA